MEKKCNQNRKLFFSLFFVSDKKSIIKTVVPALYGNIGCGFSFLLIKKLSNFCQKVNKFKENFNIAKPTKIGLSIQKKTHFFMNDLFEKFLILRQLIFFFKMPQ